MRRVSVIVPCFNHSQFLVESVEGILRQSYRDLELIIIDDCSSDKSWEIISSLASCDPRIRPIRHERNQGVSSSRNDGLRAAIGAFIGFCDADDVWEDEKLKFQVDLLESNPDYDIAYCDSVIIDQNGSPTRQRFSDLFPPPKPPSGWLFAELVERNFINTQSVIARKECLHRTGHFDEDLKVLEDWWYWIRLSRHHRFLYSQEPLAKYRMHPRSTNLVEKPYYCMNRFKVLRRILGKYADLRPAAKTNIVFKMGVDLCDIGKLRVGRWLLWSAVGSCLTDPRCLGTSFKALRRLVLSNPAFSRNLDVAPLPSVTGSGRKVTR